MYFPKKDFFDFLSSVENCASFPYIIKGVLKNYTTSSHKAVDVWCEIGYHFSDGTKRKQFSCVNGEWQLQGNYECYSMFIYNK